MSRLISEILCHSDISSRSVNYLTPFIAYSLNVCFLKATEIKISSHCNATHHTKGSFSLEETIKKQLPDLFQNHILCAGTPTSSQGSCKGDSGGPLMYYAVEQGARWVQIAVVQGAVNKCGDIDYPGLYIKLSDPSIFNFIKSAIDTFAIPEDDVETGKIKHFFYN